VQVVCITQGTSLLLLDALLQNLDDRQVGVDTPHMAHLDIAFCGVQLLNCFLPRVLHHPTPGTGHLPVTGVTRGITRRCLAAAGTLLLAAAAAGGMGHWQ
jgi:hypothetical protein